jgi:effector-binding domain-containing protein
MRIMQKLVFPSKPEHQIQMGGEMMLSCYHIGSHDMIRETYEKIEQYAANHGYKLAEDSWERYVTDCWTTNNSDMYVTEVRIGASR